MAWGAPRRRADAVTGTRVASMAWDESFKGLLYKGDEPRARVELAAGASDGRRPLDDAGHRRRLATTHGLIDVEDLRVSRVGSGLQLQINESTPEERAAEANHG